MNIYLLNADVKNFRPLVAPESFFSTFPMMDNFCVGRPMIDVWKEVELCELAKPELELVEVPSSPPGDISSFNLMPALLINDRARNVLVDLLQPQDVELLPLLVGGKRHWLLNVLRVIDALDEPNCKVVRFSDGVIMKVDEYAFLPSRVGVFPIFKVPQTSRVETYVTDKFVGRIVAAELNGLELILLWSTDNRNDGS